MGPSPEWEALWPPRKGLGPGPQGKPILRRSEPASSQAVAATPTTSGREAHELEARLGLKIAHLSKGLERWQAELVQRARSEIEIVRTSMEAVLAEQLASAESRSAERDARLEQHLAAVASLSEQLVALTLSVGDADVRIGTVERKVAQETKELERGITALRSDLLAAVAQQIESRAEAIESDVAREAALETRLKSELGDMVTGLLATRGLGEDSQLALNGRLDELEAQVRTVMGELAGLRRQLTSTEARLDHRLVPLVRRLSETGLITEALVSSTQAHAASVTALRRELLANLTRLSQSVEVHRDEAASRADVAALEAELEDRVARELTSARSQLDAKLTTLDAVVDAVDAAAAALETGLVERVTGAANVAATSALAPVRSDLRSVQAEVAATERSIRELRRQMRTSSPPPGATTARQPDRSS